MADYKYIVCKTKYDNGSTNAIQTYGSGSAGGKKPPEGYAWFPDEFMDEFYIKLDPRSGKAPKCAGFVDMTFAAGTDDEGRDIGDVCTSCTFNWDDYDAYIATLPSPIPGMIESKVAEMSNTCNNIITNGVDVVLVDGTTNDAGEVEGQVVEHFSLKSDDQANISSLFNLVLMGGTEYIYHSDGNPCRAYSADEISRIYITTQMFISQNVTYNNVIARYIKTLDTEEAISAVTWGMELTGEYLDEYNSLIATAQAQITTISANLAQQTASTESVDSAE